MTSLTISTTRAEQTRALATALTGELRRGDLLVLDGPLGAGKTTFAQGLGSGLGVRGGVASPTFVIERVHPSLADGPALVHVDAYRLGGDGDIDDLDLEADLEDAVTVVEWGLGRVEHLVASWLLVELERPDQVDDPDDPDEPRRIRLVPHGERWDGAAVGRLAAAIGGAGLAVTRDADDDLGDTGDDPAPRRADGMYGSVSPVTRIHTSEGDAENERADRDDAGEAR